MTAALLCVGCASQPPAAGLTTGLSADDQFGHIATSGFLFNRSQARGDAVGMAVAADLRADLLGAWRFADNGPGGVLSPEDMLDAARRVAGADPVALANIDRISEGRSRGRVDGPIVQYVVASVSEPFISTIDFEGNMPAVIYVEAPPTSPFNLSVRSVEVGEICDDRSERQRKICRWLPEMPASFDVKVSVSAPGEHELLLISN
ncbi:MAG: hypothetical protein AAF709_03985 [Pseudomonadota bacterium]